MNAPDGQAIAPLYAIVDHRQDGRPRIVDTFVDPVAAVAAADLLRAVGSDARVELLTAVDEGITA